MKTSATVLSIVKVLALVTGLGACSAWHGGKLKVDSPALPYQKPDISEITGIEEPDTDVTEVSGGSAEPGK